MAYTTAEKLYKYKDVLRIDSSNTANDDFIISLINALPGFIEVQTGYPEALQDNEPLIETVSGFIMRVWYYADHADDVKLQRTIDNLLKAITLKANTINRAGAGN